METLSHILASFDISQVILSVFPQIFLPVVHALQTIFLTLYDLAGKQFVSHPGIMSGTVIFLLVYASWSLLSKLRRNIPSFRTVSPDHSLRS